MTFPTHHAPRTDGADGGPAPLPAEEHSAPPQGPGSAVLAGTAPSRAGDPAPERAGDAGPVDAVATTGAGGLPDVDSPVPPWETWEPGVRVMVRTRLPEGASHLYTDLLGTVVARRPGVLTLETRTGRVDVPLSSVATGKTVPPAPARRRPRQD